MKFWMSLVSTVLLAGTATAFAASGEQTYKTACALCHDAGVSGAPKLGDKAAWAPRIKAGKDALYTIALKGKPGTAMMPKGGRMDIPDADIRASVDFMLDKSK